MIECINNFETIKGLNKDTQVKSHLCNVVNLNRMLHKEVLTLDDICV